MTDTKSNIPFSGFKMRKIFIAGQMNVDGEQENNIFVDCLCLARIEIFILWMDHVWVDVVQLIPCYG